MQSSCQHMEPEKEARLRKSRDESKMEMDQLLRTLEFPNSAMTNASPTLVPHFYMNLKNIFLCKPIWTMFSIVSDSKSLKRYSSPSQERQVRREAVLPKSAEQGSES